MPGLWFYADPIDRLHQENLQFLQAQRFKPPRNTNDHRAVEQKATTEIMRQANDRGYRCSPTGNNDPFDLWIEGAKVEIKAATYNPAKTGGRYQANIRNHTADILIFDCINGTHHVHFIPMIEISPRHHIAVWSYDPALSSGQWLPFLEAWDYLEQAVFEARHMWQLPLFQL